MTSAGIPTRVRILQAAERLLRTGKAGFSMRDLAAEAGVSFATPFNQFGSKVSIMRALSAQRIDAMRARLDSAVLPTSVFKRVLAAVTVATDVMLAEPGVNKAVMGVLGAPSDEPGSVSAQSAALWAQAIGTGDGLKPSARAVALAVLPGQLAIAFRGVLSFWTAGEYTDDELPRQARVAAAVVLLGFVSAESHEALTTIAAGGR